MYIRFTGSTIYCHTLFLFEEGTPGSQASGHIHGTYMIDILHMFHKLYVYRAYEMEVTYKTVIHVNISSSWTLVC